MPKLKFQSYDKTTNKVILHSSHKTLNELLEYLQKDVSQSKPKTNFKDLFVNQTFVPLKKSNTGSNLVLDSELDQLQGLESPKKQSVPKPREVINRQNFLFPGPSNLDEAQSSIGTFGQGKRCNTWTEESPWLDTKPTVKKKLPTEHKTIFKRISEMVPDKVTSLEILTRIEVTHESAPRLGVPTGDGWKHSVRSYTEIEPKTQTFLIDVAIIPNFQGGMIENLHSFSGPES